MTEHTPADADVDRRLAQLEREIDAMKVSIKSLSEMLRQMDAHLGRMLTNLGLVEGALGENGLLP